MATALPIARRHSPWLPLLIILATAIAGLALTHYGPTHWDVAALRWFRDDSDSSRLAGPEWITAFWLTVSWLGDVLPRIGAAALALIVLLWLRRYRDAWLMTGVLLSGIALSSTIKAWVERPRPHWVTHLDHVSSASFPSGHALNSTLFYLTIALLLAPLLRRRLARLTLYALAAVLSLSIGVSRIALGVHYPSDVMASWLIAVAWLWLWFGAAKYRWPPHQH